MDAGRRGLRAIVLVLCLAGAGRAEPPYAETSVQTPASRPVGQALSSTSNVESISRDASAENRAVRRSGTSRGSAGRDGGGEIRSAGSWWIWLQTLGILGVVLVAMGLVFKWLRKAGFGTSFGGSTAAVQVLSRGYLTNKHQMVLVRFGGRILLVGVGPQNLQLLSEVNDPAEAAQILARLEGSKAGSASQDFQQTIDAAVQQYERTGSLPPVMPEPSVTAEPEIGTLRKDLRSLLARMQSIGRKPVD